MGAEQKTHFQIDKTKCIKCRKCINTCSGMVIEFGSDGYPKMVERLVTNRRSCRRFLDQNVDPRVITSMAAYGYIYITTA